MVINLMDNPTFRKMKEEQRKADFDRALKLAKLHPSDRTPECFDGQIS